MKKINLYSLLLYLILLFVPISLLKNLFPFPITIIWGFSIFLLLLLILILSKNKEIYITLSMVVLINIINSFISEDLFLHARYFINWFSMLSVFLVLLLPGSKVKLYDAYKSNSRFLHIISLAIIGLTCLLYLDPRTHSSGWWTLSNGFTAFTISHAVAVCMVVIAFFELLHCFIENNKKNRIVFFIVYFICLFFLLQTGARVYFISMLLLFFIAIFNLIKSNVLKIRILVGSSVFLLLILPFTSFFEKIKITLSYQKINNVSLISAISSGRSDFWLIDFKYFLQSDLYSILFGNSFSSSFYINAEFFNMFIFSHNLFLETLLSMGILGLGLLCYTLYLNFNKITKKNIKICMIIYVAFIGFLNGLTDSQMYCYSILLFPILDMIFIKERYSEK